MLAIFFFNLKSRTNFCQVENFSVSTPAEKGERTGTIDPSACGKRARELLLPLVLFVSLSTSLSAVSPLRPTSRSSQVTDCEIRKPPRNKTRDKDE